MKAGQDKIYLRDLIFFAKHGVYASEKEISQQFRVNIAMNVNISPASQNDDLSLSVDYSKIYVQVKQLVEENSFNLIETLAENIANVVLKHPLVSWVDVEVEKCQAQIGNDKVRAVVRIERGD